DRGVSSYILHESRGRFPQKYSHGRRAQVEDRRYSLGTDDPLHGLEVRSVLTIELQRGETPSRLVQAFLFAQEEVIDHHQVARRLTDNSVHQVTTDEPGSTCHQHAFAR